MQRRIRAVALLAVALFLFAGCYPPLLGVPTPRPSPTPQRLVPTVPPDRLTPTPAAATPATAAASPRPTQMPPSSAARLTPAAPLAPFQFGGSPRSRVCVAIPGADSAVSDFEWGGAEPGWWLNWNVLLAPPPGPPFAQMVRVWKGSVWPEEADLAAAARANPGALWLIGNEMDVAWQDNATPEEYAGAYDKAYHILKTADPTAQVAIGGVSQPTPLRLEYLDRVLASYRERTGEEMPVDVWNVHAFVLREERDSWGVGIPPGMSVDEGVLREIEDHTDMAIFGQQIADFRGWMAERGQRDKPLVVSEYGVLMPADYGFSPDAVAQFLRSTFDFFLQATDPQTGYEGDEDRLVQAFCWYSAADDVYATSNIFDPAAKTITEVGAAYQAYVTALPE